jgi:hypothetical protein
MLVAVAPAAALIVAYLLYRAYVARRAPEPESRLPGAAA